MTSGCSTGRAERLASAARDAALVPAVRGNCQVVAQAEKLDDILFIGRGDDPPADPARRRQYVVRLSAPGTYQLVADPAREWKVGEMPSVKVTEFAPAISEFDSAKAVRIDRHAQPARHFLLDAGLHSKKGL